MVYQMKYVVDNLDLKNISSHAKWLWYNIHKGCLWNIRAQSWFCGMRCGMCCGICCGSYCGRICCYRNWTEIKLIQNIFYEKWSLFETIKWLKFKIIKTFIICKLATPSSAIIHLFSIESKPFISKTSAGGLVQHISAGTLVYGGLMYGGLDVSAGSMVYVSSQIVGIAFRLRTLDMGPMSTSFSGKWSRQINLLWCPFHPYGFKISHSLLTANSEVLLSLAESQFITEQTLIFTENDMYNHE